MIFIIIYLVDELPNDMVYIHNNESLTNNTTKSKVFFENMVDKVIQGDAIEILKQIPDNSIDMVFIDPPYFLQTGGRKLKRWGSKTIVDSVNEKWDNFTSFQEYDSFIEKLLMETKRIMKPTATIWVMGTYHNIFRVGKILQDLGYWILDNVIWFKTNPMPNWLGVRFTNATEILIWAMQNKSSKKHIKYIFNKEFARQFSMEDWGNKLAYNVWRLPSCIGKERLRDATGKKLHPTQKPEKLLERIILVSTKKGDIVLDPLAGTGTTGVVAKRLERHYIMIEREEKYIKAIYERLKTTNIK